MNDNNFCLLIPGSHAARKRRCSCEISTITQFRADPGCSIHGVAAFKRLLRTPEGKAAIQRFRDQVIGSGSRMGVRDYPRLVSKPGRRPAVPA